jgi:hypothetical protein
MAKSKGSGRSISSFARQAPCIARIPPKSRDGNKRTHSDTGPKQAVDDEDS